MESSGEEEGLDCLVQENQPVKEIDLTCFKTFPIKATTCLQVVPMSLNLLLNPIARFKWIGFAGAIGQKRRGKTMYRMGAHVHMENPPWSKTPHHTRLRCESKREQRVEPIEMGSCGKRRIDPPRGGKAAKRKGGHHTVAVLA